MEGHLPVGWLDTVLPPTRWERWSARWADLPAMLLVGLIGLIVVATLIPWPSMATPSVSRLAANVAPADATADAGAGDRQVIAATPAVAPGATSRAATPVVVASSAPVTPAGAMPGLATPDLAALGTRTRSAPRFQGEGDRVNSGRATPA